MSVSKVQKFKVERVARSAMKNAPYNPRFIDEAARKKLEKNLRKVGLVEPIIWNKRTGNVVGGNTRLRCIDAIEGNADYELDVSVVDLSVKEEKTQNIFLNNPSAQGSWDYPLLQSLMVDIGVEGQDLTGFDKLEMDQMFGRDLFAPVGAIAMALDELAEIAPPAKPSKQDNSPEAIKGRRDAHRDQVKKSDDSETYVVVVCTSREECSALCDFFGSPDDKLIDGRRVFDKLGIPLPETEAA